MAETTNPSLLAQHCTPRKGTDAGLLPDQIAAHLAQLPDWQLTPGGGEISKAFRFPDFFHTMAFVNAVASVAHREDHHPDLEVAYGGCRVRYSTHDVGGLSLNDFICAAKIEDLRVSA